MAGKIWQDKKVMLSGGGSGGPVTPLLAVAQILLKSYSSIELVFVGGKDGPEK
jgi:UDP-N-acetylglucosamine:LPS N-acetylglucosamine transferase